MAVIQIDKVKFYHAHTAFLRHMRDRGDGVPFTSFAHRFLVTDEVSYKTEALRRGRGILCFDKWPKWIARTGKITSALKEACKPSVFYNLMEYKYGDAKSSYSALYRLTTKDQITSFEEQVLQLYRVSQQPEEVFGNQFDIFADFLRSHRLGCKWDFLAYLIFLMRPERFFPIRPTHFERVLRFYGIPCEIAGHVSWERYKLILDVAEKVKDELAIYGSPTAIEIQSYMWVISYLLPKMKSAEPMPPFDFAEELRSRQRRDSERQRIGLLGERYVLEKERAMLVSNGRSDLAEQVRLVSLEGGECGYDVHSFALDGLERHIEVKTTVQSKHESDCFWLSENEVQQAESDSQWTVFRVWNVDSEPHHEDLGNVVTTSSHEWERIAATWIVRRKV